MKTSGYIKLIQFPNIYALPAGPGAWVRAVMLELFLLMHSACAHYPVNSKLESIDPVLQKKDRRLGDSRQSSEELLLILAFSGGGTRAVAPSNGVC